MDASVSELRCWNYKIRPAAISLTTIGCMLHATMSVYTFIILTLFECLALSQYIDPCLSLSRSYESLVANNKSALFPPSQVLACLRTVPVNETLSSNQIDWIQSFLQFQSTLSYLQSPPSGYELPAVDILGGLQAIQSKIESGGYNSTFYIESDLQNLINAAYDGHLHISPDLVDSSNFQPIRNAQLVSISSNGTDLPKIYFLDDLLASNASDLVSIDGVEIDVVLQSLPHGFQNLDALYNSVLYNIPGTVFNGGILYNTTGTFVESDNTTYKFRNGTMTTISNSVAVALPLSNITSGQDLFNKFLFPKEVRGNSSTSQSSSASQSETATSTKASSSSDASPSNSLVTADIEFPTLGYPRPLFSTSDLTLTGFFLPNSTDTCVLNVLGFANPLNPNYGVPTGASATAYGSEFQNTTKNFLAACKANGRTKLLIDVRSNNGGIIYFGYDLFKQLFPTRPVYSGTNFRAHAAANVLGQIASTLGPVLLGESGMVWNLQSSDFNSNNSLSSPSQTPFGSWQAMYGPVAAHNDRFTNLLAWSLSNVPEDLSYSGLVPAGFGNNTQSTPQPFADENITLITDAQCSSTCGVFVNLLLTQTNISTVAFGGRPTTNPMAVIGGTEGGEEYTFKDIQGYAVTASTLLTNKNTSALVSQFLNTTKEEALKILQPLTVDPPLNLVGGAAGQSLNFRNSIAQGDTSLTPLQFAAPILADCKVFYLRGDVLNVTYTWERVAKGQFICADGGNLGQKQNGTTGPAPYTKSAASQMSLPFGSWYLVVTSLLLWMW